MVEKKECEFFVHLEKQACLNVGLHENTQGRVELSPQDIFFFFFTSVFYTGEGVIRNQRELALRG